MQPEELNIAIQGSIRYGGVSRVVIELSKALAKKVSSVTVFPTPNSVPNPAEHEWWGDIPTNLTIKGSCSLLKTFARDVFSFRKYDIIHVHYGTFGLSAVATSILFDVPFVYTVHGSLEKNFKEKGLRSWITDELIERRLSLPVTSKYGKLVTVSEYSKNVLKGRVNSDIGVVYHGINKHGGNLSSDTSTDVREQFNLTDDTEICLCVSRFYPSKNIDELVKAAKLIEINNDTDVEFLLVGGGDGFERISELVEEIGVNNVRILQDISDEQLSQLYSESDLFVLPSTTETFGIVFLEAMASDTPVICADKGAAPEVVGDAGVQVEPNNPELLSSKINEILADDGEYKKLLHRSRDRVNNFTWDHAADQYIEEYLEIVE